MNTSLDLHSVLTHPPKQQPQSGYLLKRVTRYGDLRLFYEGADPERLTAEQNEAYSDGANRAIAAAFAQPGPGDDPTAALRVLQEAMSTYPLVAPLYANAARLYEQLNDLDQSIYYARQAISLDTSPHRLQALARYLGLAGRADEALVLFETLWAIRHECDDQTRADALQNHLHLLLVTERWARMHKVASTVWLTDRQHVTAGFHVVLALYQLGRQEEARRELDALESLVPTDSVLFEQTLRLRDELGGPSTRTVPPSGSQDGNVARPAPTTPQQEVPPATPAPDPVPGGPPGATPGVVGTPGAPGVPSGPPPAPSGEPAGTPPSQPEPGSPDAGQPSPGAPDASFLGAASSEPESGPAFPSGPAGPAGPDAADVDPSAPGTGATDQGKTEPEPAPETPPPDEPVAGVSVWSIPQPTDIEEPADPPPPQAIPDLPPFLQTGAASDEPATKTPLESPSASSLETPPAAPPTMPEEPPHATPAGDARSAPADDVVAETPAGPTDRPAGPEAAPSGPPPWGPPPAESTGPGLSPTADSYPGKAGAQPAGATSPAEPSGVPAVLVSELHEVIRHQEPAGPFPIRRSSPWGELRIDYSGQEPPPSTQPPTEADLVEINRALDASRAALNGESDPPTARHLVKKTLLSYPHVAQLYGNLALLQQTNGELGDACHSHRQAVACEPTEDRLEMLAHALAVAGHEDQAQVVFDYLWPRRELLSPEARRTSLQNYLTLLRNRRRWAQLASVAEEAWAEDNGNVDLGINAVFGHQQAGDAEAAHRAQERLRTITPYDHPLADQIHGGG